jgi:probable F420-dependent oxidoreductase
MKTDAPLDGHTSGVAGRAVRAHRLGFAGVWAGETDHDALLAAAVATQAAPEIEVGTRVAIAFARSPMSLAICGNDMQMLSRGKFTLGLGSQVRAHIERRYGMRWDRPVARMRELIAALRAIWTAWADETPLDFRGDFFSHTLMNPGFRPEPHAFGQPLVGLAAMGPQMVRVAAEAADVLLVHSFMTERYLRQVLVPSFRGAAIRAGRDPAGLQVSLRVLLATGEDEQQQVAAIREVRRQIAFYASTPAYALVLEAHGWADVQSELASLARQERWAEMGDLVDDEMLRAFAVTGDPAEVGAEVRRRFADCADRVDFRCPAPLTDDQWRAIIAAVGARDGDGKVDASPP